jgi:membrane-associated phospholipid phosphatase
MGLAAAAPMALCVVRPRSRTRDVAVSALQMWAYLAGYEIPNDDPEALRRRARVQYPIALDRLLGLGTLPTLRLQRRLARTDRFSRTDAVLVWAHWMWFFVPHSELLYILVRRPTGFGRAGVLMYAVFDLGVVVYWVLPTAPPWWAAARGHIEHGRTPQMRRMMVEYGEYFWRDGWGPLYSLLGGNPLAAMPSLHFATSVMGAQLLTETGPVAGAVGWAYAATLGLALVYLGEHYVVDLIAGFALAQGVRRVAPRVAPVLSVVARGLRTLEVRARA